MPLALQKPSIEQTAQELVEKGHSSRSKAVPSHKVPPTPCTDKAKPQTSRQRKSRKRPRRLFTKKAKRVNLELTGHESVTGILCNLSKVQAFSGFPSPNTPARSR